MKRRGWRVTEGCERRRLRVERGVVKVAAERVFHVWPVDDLRAHQGNLGDRVCWCVPTVQRRADGLLVVHNAADARELIEQHGVN